MPTSAFLQSLAKFSRWSDPAEIERDLIKAERKSLALNPPKPYRKDDAFLSQVEDWERHKEQKKEAAIAEDTRRRKARARKMAEKGDAYIVNESDDDWTDVDDAEHEDPDYEANRMKYIPPSKKEKAFHIAREATIDVLEGGSIAKNRFFDGNYYGATSKAARTLGKGVWEVGKLVGMGVKEGALLAGEAVNNAGFLDRLPGSAKSVQARLDRAEEALMGRGQTERMYWQAKEARAGGVIDFQKEKSDEWQKEEEEWVNGDFTLDPDLVNIDRTEHHPDLQRVRDAKHAAKLAKYQARHEDSGSDSDYDIYSTTRNEYSVQREYVPGGKGVLNMVPCPYLPELTPEEEEEAKQCGFF